MISSTPARGAGSLVELLDTLRLTDAMLGILAMTLKREQQDYYIMERSINGCIFIIQCICLY